MKRILIVDDDLDILDCLQLVLAGDYEVALARNGEEAVAKATASHFDLILLDLMMPLLSGEEVVRQLGERGVASRIVLSSASGNLPEQAKQLGLRDYITKPYDFTSFESKIAAWLSSS